MCDLDASKARLTCARRDFGFCRCPFERRQSYLELICRWKKSQLWRVKSEVTIKLESPLSRKGKSSGGRLRKLTGRTMIIPHSHAGLFVLVLHFPVPCSLHSWCAAEPLAFLCPISPCDRTRGTDSHGQPLLQVLQRARQLLRPRSSGGRIPSTALVSAHPTKDHHQLTRETPRRRW